MAADGLTIGAQGLSAVGLDLLEQGLQRRRRLLAGGMDAEVLHGRSLPGGNPRHKGAVDAVSVG